jgi:hypothetical protein
MNCNPTLTAEEFKTIHNALWELDGVKQELESVLHKDLYIKLAQAASKIRQLLPALLAHLQAQGTGVGSVRLAVAKQPLKL